MLSPRLPPRPNLTGIACPAFALFHAGRLSTGWRNPVNGHVFVTLAVAVTGPYEVSLRSSVPPPGTLTRDPNEALMLNVPTVPVGSVRVALPR